MGGLSLIKKQTILNNYSIIITDYNNFPCNKAKKTKQKLHENGITLNETLQHKFSSKTIILQTMTEFIWSIDGWNFNILEDNRSNNANDSLCQSFPFVTEQAWKRKVLAVGLSYLDSNI